MCTNPIQLTRVDPLTHSSRIDVVPCGKCAECKSFKRQEFAALSVHQALVSGTIYFLTLTYDDEHLPVAITDVPEDSSLGGQLLGFDMPSEREIPISWFTESGKFMNMTHFHDGLSYTCSLCRNDVKKWLTQFRIEFEREHGFKPQFKYCFFGEFGEQRGRPHYHGLLYGCTAEMASSLCELWKSKYGYSYCVPPDFRQLSLDEICKVSNYVSKYISKGIHSNFAHLLPYIERPRRMCSRDFGSFSKDELVRLRNYYDGADIKYLDKESFLEQVTFRRKSLQLVGKSFPIPLRIKEKIFYEPSDSKSFDNVGGAEAGISASCSDKIKVVNSFKNRRTKVSSMVARFARNRFDKNLDRQFRACSKGNILVSPDEVVRQALVSEKASLESRAQISEKNILTQLKINKDGQ